MNEALITLDNLGIGYNGQPVLSGISMSINRGSFTAIIGANGSGKSTLLRTILGLIQPVTGYIDDNSSLSGKPLAFGYVPQSIMLDSVYLLTGFEVALMGAYGRIGPGRFVPKGEKAFTRECLHATGAEEFAGKPFAELSGGQKQRVLIARALTTRPDVLVLDEPTAGVDRETTHSVLEFISEIHKERKITVLLVTHDFASVRRYAEQVIWLHDGNLFYGQASDLLTSERIAEIFGTRGY